MKATRNNIKVGTILQVKDKSEWGNWKVSKMEEWEGHLLITVDKTDGSGGVTFDAHNWIIIKL